MIKQDPILDNGSIDQNSNNDLSNDRTVKVTNWRKAASPNPEKKKQRLSIHDKSATLAKLKNVDESTNQQIEEHECDVFGNHVSKQLKKMSTELCIYAQQEIQNVLTRCRLEDLKRHQPMDVNFDSNLPVPNRPDTSMTVCSNNHSSLHSTSPRSCAKSEHCYNLQLPPSEVQFSIDETI